MKKTIGLKSIFTVLIFIFVFAAILYLYSNDSPKDKINGLLYLGAFIIFYGLFMYKIITVKEYEIIVKRFYIPFLTKKIAVSSLGKIVLKRNSIEGSSTSIQFYLKDGTKLSYLIFLLRSEYRALKEVFTECGIPIEATEL